VQDRVREALSKRSPYGPDVDLDAYRLGKPEVGGDVSRSGEAGEVFRRQLGLEGEQIAYLQVEQRAFYSTISSLLSKYGVVVKPLSVAVEEDEIAGRLAWSLIPPDTDKYTAAAHLYGGELGYYVYVPEGVRLPVPIFTCLGIFSERSAQFAHNVVYVDRGAEAYVTTGCLIPHGVRGGLHVGVSEFFVGEGGRLVFTMLHSWAPGTHVRPRTAVRVDKNGEYVSYYAIYSPVKSIQAYPTVFLGEGSTTHMVSVVSGSEGGVYDIGGRAVIKGEGATAEIVSRILARGGADVTSRAEIVSKAGRSKGHIECLGLLLDDASSISSIPVISSGVQDAELTHEAAIGTLRGEEVEYLMSKGLSEEEARSLLIRGFVMVETPRLPEKARASIEKIMELVVKEATG